MSLRSLLTGTGVAVVTPFKSDSSVDFKALENIVNHIIDGGAEYIVTLGTTGETSTLTKDEKLTVLDVTLDVVNKRVPVVVGIGGNNTASIIKDLQDFPLDNVAAVLSASPYYNKPSQEGLFLHYKALAEASSKPILLYNVPGRTGRNMTAKTTLRLAHEVPNIGGIKEAHNDMPQCLEIIRDRPEHFLVVTGDDEIALPQIAFGFDGVISVNANAFPKLVSDMIRYCLKGDFAAARPIHYKFLEAYDMLFVENNPAGVKAFMYELGLLENELRLPVTPVSAELQAKIKAYVATF
ncbi:4-hydroxy-tetrahydrodipicolinate synthase [Parasediminibacterium paludis]|jgi:4-hydroxy-tetrahydrodipicolinate synthase|uniref:4-hydroxy-tetrahydrodipicolinate synthase n=1 Tax=Parasediminibacterium paludis TaxID=908966 RepID=A0ABV8PVN9_9BACT